MLSASFFYLYDLQLPHIITMSVMFTHISRRDWNVGYMGKGALLPHPWGERWLADARYALTLLSERKKLLDYHFYPLLARHCSDGDINGMVISSYSFLVDLKM